MMMNFDSNSCYPFQYFSDLEPQYTYSAMLPFDGVQEDVTVEKLLSNPTANDTSQLNDLDLNSFMKLPDGEMINNFWPFITFGEVQDITDISLETIEQEISVSPPTEDIVPDTSTPSDLNTYTDVEKTCNSKPDPSQIVEKPTPTPKKPIRKRKPKNPKRGRSANRSIHLWEFLKELLTTGNSNCIQWLSEKDGTFRLVNSSAVAKLWGERKNRHNMTYEKMSRALRYYYEKQILERVPNARLIYKFGNRTRSSPSETSEESLSDSSDN